MLDWLKRLFHAVTPNFLKPTRAMLTVEAIHVSEESWTYGKLDRPKQTHIDKHTFELKEDIMMIDQITSVRLVNALEKQGGAVIKRGNTIYVSPLNYRSTRKILLQWDADHQTYRYMFEKRVLRDQDAFQLVGLIGTQRGKISSGGKTTFYYQRVQL